MLLGEPHAIFCTVNRLISQSAVIGPVGEQPCLCGAYHLPCTQLKMHSFTVPSFFGAAVFAVASAQTTYDYVIVGGGTTGLVVANRLSEDPKSTYHTIESRLTSTETDDNLPQSLFW